MKIIIKNFLFRHDKNKYAMNKVYNYHYFQKKEFNERKKFLL